MYLPYRNITFENYYLMWFQPNHFTRNKQYRRPKHYNNCKGHTIMHRRPENGQHMLAQSTIPTHCEIGVRGRNSTTRFRPTTTSKETRCPREGWVGSPLADSLVGNTAELLASSQSAASPPAARRLEVTDISQAHTS